MYKNRNFIIAVILGIICSAAAGLALSYVNNQANKSTQNEQIVLNMDGYTYTYQQMQPIITEYEQQNKNVTINYTQIDPSQYKNYVLDRIKSGSTSVSPDIFEAGSTDQNTFTKYTAPAPATIMTVSEFKNDFYPVFQRGLIYNNQAVIGMPESIDPMIIMYNTQLMQQVGSSIGAITASNTIFDNTIAALAKSNPKLAIINIGDPTHIQDAGDILQLFMLENGVVMNNPSNTSLASFNTNAGILAMQYYTSFVNGSHQDNWNLIQNESDITAFAKGQLLARFGYASEIPTIRAINPAIQIGYGIYPSLLNPTDLADYNYLTVSKYSTNSTAAWEFIKYLSKKQTVTTLSESTAANNAIGIIPARKDTPPTVNDTAFVTTLTQAATISTDWNREGRVTTQGTFNTALSNFLGGYSGQASLDGAATSIDKTIQTALAL